jgi:hypothetical protein
MLSAMDELIDPAAVAFATAHTTPCTGAVADAAEWTAHNTAYPQMMGGLPEARLLEGLIAIAPPSNLFNSLRDPSTGVDRRREVRVSRLLRGDRRQARAAGRHRR